jgi:hypothetical protein
MECGEFLARYSEFLDGELGEATQGEFFNHVEMCEKCSNYKEILSDGLQVYRKQAEVSLSDDFSLRLQHRLFHVREGLRKKRSAVLIRGIAPTAAASAVFLFTIFVLSSKYPLDEGSVDMAALQQNPQGEVAVRSVDNTGKDTGEAKSARNVRVRGGRRDWDKKFVRNNMWRVFTEPSTASFADDYSGVQGSGVLPLKVSTAPAHQKTEENFIPLDNSRYMGLGVSIAPVEFQLQGETKREIKKGLRVLKVKQMTPAHIAGILPGDTIVSIEHIPVQNTEKLSRLVQAFSYQTKSVQIYRMGRSIELYVDL